MTTAATRFSASLAMQRRVIVALFFREMRTRFGNTRLGYVWALGEPIAHVAILATIFSFVGRAPKIGDSTAVFFFTGIIPFLFFRKAAQRVQSAVKSNAALLNYPPVRPIDTMFARGALEVATMMLSTVIIAVVFLGLGLPVLPDQPLVVLSGLLLASLLGVSFGVFNGAMLGVIPSWSTMISWVMRVLYFTSGIFFVIDMLPIRAREVLVHLPTSHVITLVRDGQFGSYESAYTDPMRPLLWALTLLALGLCLERIVRRRSEE